MQSAGAAARAKGHPLVVVRASSEHELDEAFAALFEHHVAGVLAVSDNFLSNRRDQIIAEFSSAYRAQNPASAPPRPGFDFSQSAKKASAYSRSIAN
jgi:hypothetical protein